MAKVVNGQDFFLFAIEESFLYGHIQGKEADILKITKALLTILKPKLEQVSCIKKGIWIYSKGEEDEQLM